MQNEACAHSAPLKEDGVTAALQCPEFHLAFVKIV